MKIRNVLTASFSFALVFFFIGGLVHGLLFEKLMKGHLNIFRNNDYVYLFGFLILILHGLILSVAYEYLIKNKIKISTIRYAITFGLATSFINIINQLCWFNLDTIAHTIIAILYYIPAYFIWGVVLSKIYQK